MSFLTTRRKCVDYVERNRERMRYLLYWVQVEALTGKENPCADVKSARTVSRTITMMFGRLPATRGCPVPIPPER